MHSTRTSTALFASVHTIAVYIGFQGKKVDSALFAFQSFNCQNLWPAICHVNRVLELANITSINAS
jgi:hypothetical protein